MWYFMNITAQKENKDYRKGIKLLKTKDEVNEQLGTLMEDDNIISIGIEKVKDMYTEFGVLNCLKKNYERELKQTTEENSDERECIIYGSPKK